MPDNDSPHVAEGSCTVLYFASSCNSSSPALLSCCLLPGMRSSHASIALYGT
jgi:hypothetical protein